METPAVLLIVFKREDSAEKVFQAIRNAKPKKFYIAADGPRNEKEKIQCEKVRSIISKIDWPCEVKKNFRTSNVGIKKNISEAISWFLNEVGEGIILEDDCLPSEYFFEFAAINLEYFRNDSRIFQISGSAFQPRIRGEASFFYSRYNHGWGWATWKRAWDLCDLEMKSLNNFLREADRLKFWESKKERKYWSKFFKEQSENKIDTWDYQWKFTLWKNSGLCIYPNFNMIKNLGFTNEGTNTIANDDNKADRPYQIPILGNNNCIIFPECMVRDRLADKWTFNNLYWGTPLKRLKNRFEKLKKLILKKK